MNPRNFSIRPPKVGAHDVSIPLKTSRSIWLTLFAGAFLAVFCLPYLSMGLSFPDDGIDDLSDLVSLLFMLMWYGGWTMGVLVIFAFFLATLIGRERLIVTPGVLFIRYEMLGAGVSLKFAGQKMSHLRYQNPEAGSTNAIRKGHIAFDYEGSDIHVGWDMTELEASGLIQKIAERAVDMPAAEPAPDETNTSSLQAREIDPQPEAEMGRLSSVALIVANLIPIVGVLFLDWRVGDVMLVYWAESAVVAVFNVAKMAVIGGWSTLFYGPFFFFHYGGFMVGHLLFIYGFMISGPGDDSGTGLSEVFADFYLLLPALIALFVSHGISFYLNFLGRREYEGRDIKDQMSEPYRRIIVMHVTIIFGGFLAMALDSAIPALLLMIVLKVGADLRAHRKEHVGEIELVGSSGSSADD